MACIVPDYKKDGLWVSSFYEGGKQCRTKSSSVWSHMKSRCKAGGYVQRIRPTYSGCTMAAEFYDYQVFADWFNDQIGIDSGFHLDKDLLSTGNKKYGPDSCVFIPNELNCFLCSCEKSRGKYPQGVSWFSRDNLYKVQVNQKYGKKHVGYYKTLEQAKSAYIAAKNKEARVWYGRLISGEFIVDPRVTERMRTWEFTYPEDITD